MRCLLKDIFGKEYLVINRLDGRVGVVFLKTFFVTIILM